MSTAPSLTYDEQRAAEAAFQGLPLNPKWSRHAQEIYLGIVALTHGREIAKGKETSAIEIDDVEKSEGGQEPGKEPSRKTP
jgi:hypothetical protein